MIHEIYVMYQACMKDTIQIKISNYLFPLQYTEYSRSFLQNRSIFVYKFCDFKELNASGMHNFDHNCILVRLVKGFCKNNVLKKLTQFLHRDYVKHLTSRMDFQLS